MHYAYTMETIVMSDIFQGERMNPKKQFGRDRLNYIYHESRYKFAETYIKDKSVLDLGCGSGYGAKILSTNAKKVLAIDKSKDTIEFAKNNFGNEKVEFICANVLETGINYNSVDVVVCFEVIEHLETPDLLIMEIKRVLKKDGLLIISTPNKDIASPNSDTPINPFHKKEYTLDELKCLFSEYFSQRQFYGEWPNLDMAKSYSTANKIDKIAQRITRLDLLRLRKIFPINFRTAVAEGFIDKTVDIIQHNKHENYLISEINERFDAKAFICLCRN